MMMFQCKLTSKDKMMIVLLSDEKDFKVGDWVTLKSSDEPNLKWKVEFKSDPIPLHSIKRGWNNNI